ncbi:hypothetical protein ACI79P_21280 [Blastococcus sp. SYSU DS0510]
MSEADFVDVVTARALGSGYGVTLSWADGAVCPVPGSMEAVIRRKE